MKVEIDIVVNEEGTVGYVKHWALGEALVEFHNGIELEEEWWDNDDFIIVHTITMEHEYEV